MDRVLQRYLEPLVRLALSDLAQEVSAGLADAACCCQHSLSWLRTHTHTKYTHTHTKPSGCETAFGRLVGSCIILLFEISSVVACDGFTKTTWMPFELCTLHIAKHVVGY